MNLFFSVHRFALLPAILVVLQLGSPGLQAEDAPATVVADFSELHLDLRQREAAIRQLTEQLMVLDRRVERRVGDITRSLSKVEDSRASGTRMITLKEEVTKGLSSLINDYARERKDLGALYTTEEDPLTKEIVKHYVNNYLDPRLEARINQVVEVTASLNGNTLFKADRNQTLLDPLGRPIPNQSGGAARDRARHDRLTSSRGNASQEAVAEALQRDLNQLNNQAETLRLKLAPVTDPDIRQAVFTRIEELEQQVETRMDQIQDLYGATREEQAPVSNQEARNLEQAVYTQIIEIKKDIGELEQVKEKLGQEHLRRRQIQKTLEAATAAGT